MLILFKRLIQTLDNKRKFRVIFLISLMLLSSITELFSITLLIPFISTILDNKQFEDTKIISILKDTLDQNFLPLLFTFIISIFIISGLLRIYTLIWSNKFAASISNEIIYKAYDVILNEDYENHIRKQKSNLITTIHTNGNILLNNIIIPVLALLESILFIFLLCILLIFYNWRIFITISLMLFIIYSFFSKKAKNILKIESKRQLQLSNISLERLDTDLNSIEYIHLGNLQRFFSENYAKSDKELKMSFAKFNITARFPKIAIELIFLIILLLVCLLLYLNGSIKNSLPLIATGGLVAQKFFPYLQKLYENFSSLLNYKESFSTVIEYASKYKNNNYKNEKYQIIEFDNIKFQSVNFSYDISSAILKNITFSIYKGEKVAIIGNSGSGKTTILRLICGLILPTTGIISLNGEELNKENNHLHTVKWMRSIGYVPQKINVTGRTLRENIVFGNKPKTKKIISIEEVIKITLLEELVERCNGLDNEIIQNSFSISGGENQRLAIARALYRNPKLLIMDEPTSSLDNKTQRKLFDNLSKLSDLTCIVITHRIETQYFFDRIFEVKENCLIEK